MFNKIIFVSWGHIYFPPTLPRCLRGSTENDQNISLFKSRERVKRSKELAGEMRVGRGRKEIRRGKVGGGGGKQRS